MTTTQPTPYNPQSNQAAYTTPPNSQGHPQYALLQQQRQYSPTASHPQTPSPNSPSSPQPPNALSSEFLPLPLAKRPHPSSPEHGRLPYLPAALRPTDPPRSQPLTPPRSVHGSTDSLVKKGKLSRPGTRGSATIDTASRRLNRSYDLLSHLPSEDIDLAFTQTTDLAPPSGSPTRASWKPDINASVCDFGTCSKLFGLWERRHHCRKCGNIFCNEHSSDRIPLDQNAEFHPQGELVRACGHCSGNWVQWVEERVRLLKEGNNTKDTEPASPVGVLVKGESNSDTQKGGGGFVAGSVGITGDWSTF